MADLASPVPVYPRGTVRALLATDLVTDATRAALTARLASPTVVQPAFFTGPEFILLRAVCARLLTGQGETHRIDVAGGIDAQLAAGSGDGWRFAALPADGMAHRAGLAGIDRTARALHGAPFTELSGVQQDGVLQAVQTAAVHGADDAWQGLAAGLYFKQLLTDAVTVFYGHPLAQERIGYVGMADAHGWQAIGLDEREAHEPLAGRSV